MTKDELIQSAIEDQIIAHAVENEAGQLTPVALCTAAAYVAHLNAQRLDPLDSLVIGEALTCLLEEYNWLSKDGPGWDETLNGVEMRTGTQAEVESFAEASVDAAMARAAGAR